MDPNATLPSLSDDIQRALQQAVGDANNAAALVHANGKAHKKSKRQREDGQDAGEGVKKRKKSKKHSDGDAHGGDQRASAGAGASSEQGASTSSSASESMPTASGISSEHTPGVLGDPAASTKKKKKKKGKERALDVAAPALVPVPPHHPQPELGLDPPSPPMMDLATSSADFLSAVVAAASATAGPQPQGGMSFDQAMQQYMAYPPPEFDPYAYPGPPPLPHPDAHPPIPPPDQPPFHGAFPDTTGLLPDLNFASSEDLLRSLQEFDISKVVTVLKTLGEAAAAANVQLNVPPMFGPGLGMPGLPPPPVQQQPVRSEAILGRPPKQKKGRAGCGADAVADVAPAPLQPDNPDHAHMLANVWMNPAKLAELVKTEGRCSFFGFG